ncbi:LysR family transcriptional regulator [Variovorax saccharolyticus]|uniref:LysR family transcriptional regulator n=1 Tax=Variovorax saccharolyticus TaxID=3053516 RepID=UPI00257866FB|nr:MULTISPECIES: LysR substrate-binding domain-containing protein [unclassified Variovorax]MDM0016003.1 LysR substrate-binding domain-containing protein [Variovorax sp. J22R187]MDM0025043.1 LysR substrate-binding domain-containing protein [Variovorax sp. J31P216]
MNLLASMRYLVALEEHRHFGRAAQACHITQPALSNALRALETEFGVVVVKRGRTYAGLTHEGEAVLAAAHRMLRENELLQQLLKSEEGYPRGSLRMAAVPTAIPLLARFAAQLQARHPGIAPTVLSMSSLELETGLENLSLDIALGYTERMQPREVKLTAWPQSIEHYFLLRRAEGGGAGPLRIGEPIGWAQAAGLPLCLLTPEMHNRSIVDQAFKAAGAVVAPAIETNSVLTLALSVLSGQVCAVLPGAMVDAVRGQGQLEALPLVGPEVRTPIGFMTQTAVRPSRALEAALALLQSPGWQAEVAAHSGALRG